MILWFKLVLVYGQRHNLIVFVRNFISVQWRSHSSIAGIVNYHVFKFMVPLSAHLVLKEEIASLRKTGKDRQVELSKLVTRLVKLEQKR